MTSIGYIYLDFLKYKYTIRKMFDHSNQLWWYSSRCHHFLWPVIGIVREYYIDK